MEGMLRRVPRGDARGSVLVGVEHAQPAFPAHVKLEVAPRARWQLTKGSGFSPPMEKQE